MLVQHCSGIFNIYSRVGCCNASQLIVPPLDGCREASCNHPLHGHPCLFSVRSLFSSVDLGTLNVPAITQINLFCFNSLLMACFTWTEISYDHMVVCQLEQPNVKATHGITTFYLLNWWINDKETANTCLWKSVIQKHWSCPLGAAITNIHIAKILFWLVLKMTKQGSPF